MLPKVSTGPKHAEVDPIELEEKYHEADEMCAISVIDTEINYLQNIAN